jgi:hypothetical protein
MVLKSIGGMLQFKDSGDLKEISQTARFPHLHAAFVDWLVLKSLGGMLQFKDSGGFKEISQLAGFPHLAGDIDFQFGGY